MLLPVSDVGFLNVAAYDVPSGTTAGTLTRISVSFKNSGTSSINQIMLHVEGDGIEEQVENLGAVSGGTSTTADVYVRFPSAGKTAINMYLTYVDSYSEEHRTETSSYTINVRDSEKKPEPDPQIVSGLVGYHTTASLAALVVCICGSLLLAGIIIVRRNRR
jgi:hypothetical protein